MRRYVPVADADRSKQSGQQGSHLVIDREFALGKPAVQVENDECFIDRGLSSAYESLNKAARGWPFASGGAESGSLKSAVQCQFLISGISSRCSRMYS
jgi:hypothetical protein